MHYPLSKYNAIALRVKFDNPFNFTLFSVYFQTKSGGWFASHQSAVLACTDWQQISIPISAFSREENPSGWESICKIRLSVFGKENAKPSVILISDLKAVASKGSQRNMFVNSSFEYCSTEKLPDYWGTEHWGIRGDANVADTDTWRAKWGVDNTISHSGKSSMRIRCSNDLTDSMLTSLWLSLKSEKTYTFSAWIRSDTDNMPVELSTESVGRKQVSVGKDWKRYWLTGKTTSSGRYRCFVSSKADGAIWVDDVQFEEGTEPTNYMPSVSDGFLRFTKILHNNVKPIPDYDVHPGKDTVSVQIDKYRRFLVDGEPFIPFAVGWENLPSPVILQDAAKAGFNAFCFQPRVGDLPRLRPLLDSAKQNGLKVILWFPFDISLSEFREWITALKDHPSIIAWYIYDEPQEITPEIRQKYELAKQIDPERPAYINYVNYPADDIGDIASLDRYPIPMDPPGSMGPWTDQLEVPASKTGKPSWIWLQSTGYAYYIPREPWDSETECMAYVSLIHGARGIKYFAQKPHSAELWNQLRVLAREIRELTPILYSVDIAPTVNMNGIGVDYTVKRYQDKTYIVAVNLLSNANRVSFTVPESKAAEVVFENRKLKISKGLLKDTFKPYQRHVYCLQSSN